MQLDMGPVAATICGLLILFLGGSVWIGISLFLVGIGGFFFYSDVAFGSIIANVAWNNTSGSAMMALPFFIWMGEILFRSRISSDLFRGLAPWMDAIPGRLIHVNIMACTFFAAVSGSSAATTATVGKITVPELERRKYDHNLSIGSLAGAGTLGFMIPPEHDDARLRHHRRCEHRQALHRGLHPGIHDRGHVQRLHPDPLPDHTRPRPQGR